MLLNPAIRSGAFPHVPICIVRLSLPAGRSATSCEPDPKRVPSTGRTGHGTNERAPRTTQFQMRRRRYVTRGIALGRRSTAIGTYIIRLRSRRCLQSHHSKAKAHRNAD
jgi:hypothetical protein